jgi:ribosomal protein S8
MVIQYDIGNLISILNNGLVRKRLYVDIIQSNKILNIVKCLYYEGYLAGYTLQAQHNIRIYLKYKDKESVIIFLKALSKPSRRLYYSYNMLRRLNLANKYIVYSSNKGILINRGIDFEMNKVGGEILFEIR